MPFQSTSAAVHLLRSAARPSLLMYLLVPLRRTARWAPVPCLALATGEARAQAVCNASLVYAPFDVSSVPSLTTWILLILSLAVGLLAVRRIRKDSASMQWAVLVSASVLIATNSLVAQKALADNFDASDPAGGTLTIAQPGPHTVTNSSGIALQIANLSSATGFAAATTCQAGQSLAPGASCQLMLDQCISNTGPGGGTGGGI